MLLLCGSLVFAQSEPTEPAGPERWAVVVGVSDYVDPDIPDVAHARADAEAVRDWLTTVGGVPGDHVMLLLDDGDATLQDAGGPAPARASRVNVMDAVLNWLPERADADDEVFFYFSGQAMAHGSTATGTLLPHDARRSLPAESGLSARWLAGALGRVDAAATVVWLDSSFRGRGEADTTDVASVIRPGTLPWGDDTLVWMASDGSRRAAEARDVPHGAFTQGLLRALRASDGTVARTWVGLNNELRPHPTPWSHDTVLDSFSLAGTTGPEVERPTVVSQMGHGDAVTALAWHPSRNWIASGDSTGVVQIVSVDDEVVRARFYSGRRGVDHLVFSEDGELLFVGGSDGVVRAWYTSDATLRWQTNIASRRGISDLSLRGENLAVTTDRGRVRLIKAINGKIWGRWVVGESLRGIMRVSGAQAVAWSPDGEVLATAADNGELAMWHPSAGELIGSFVFKRLVHGADRPLRAVTFTPDGRLLVGGDDGTVQLWQSDPELRGETADAELASNGFVVDRLAVRPGEDAEVAVAARTIRLWGLSGSEPRLEILPPSRTTSMAWSADGEVLVTGHLDGSMRAWNGDTGEAQGTLAGQRAGVRGIEVAGESGLLAIVGEAGATVWDLRRGRLAHRLEGHDGVVHTVAFVDDDAKLVTGGQDGSLRWWNASSGDLVDTWAAEASVLSVDVREDTVLLGTPPGVQVWRRGEEPTRLHQWALRREEVQRARFCHRDKGVLVQWDGRFQYRTLADGKRDSRSRRAQVTGCSPDADRVVVGTRGGGVALFGSQTLLPAPPEGSRTGVVVSGSMFLRDPAGTLEGDHRIESLGFHREEPLLVGGAQGATTKVWNLQTGELLFELDTYGSTAVAFYEPGNLVITGSSDGAVQLWDLSTGALLANAMAAGTEWLVWTPDGLFDGSKAGRRSLFRWRISDTLHAPSRFNEGFYEPALLKSLAEGKRPRARRDIASLAPPPEVEILSPAQGDVLTEGVVQVEVGLTDRGGGVSEPRLYVNGHRVAASRGLELPDQGQGDVTFRVELSEGPNHLRATAFNGDGNWEALGDEVTVEWEAPITEAPKLHVLAVGIDDYRNSLLKLGFARDDAEAVGGFFEPGLFGEVVPHVLVDDEASLEGIREAFEELARTAAPRDALLVYLAGHGVLEGEVFYFLPWDAQVGSDEEVTASGLSQQELGEALATVPATKQLVVLDACHSGAASSALATMIASRSSPGLIRAQTRLASSTGAFLIAASTDAQVAHEIPELGHGVLTYAILQGLGEEGEPEAHLNRDGNVTVNTLIQYVSESVPRLTEQYRQARQEVVQAADGQDFPLVAP
ncbi:MAG: caspase family protein [Myxococcales bacterium]|nr:caspase family protein [Myxococcales bacterium]